MSKSRAPSFSNAESAACSRKISAAELKSNAAPKPRRLATSPMIHQSGLASPGAARNARCREMRRSELVTVPDFSPQACAGSSTCAPASTVSLETHVLGNDEQFELLQRVANGVGVRQRHRRIGAHHPQRLDLAARDRLEHLDRLQPLMGGDARRLPEPAHAIDVRRRKAHMGGELVGEPADLAAAHRIGLPGQRERRRARLADPPGREMAIDDGVDLVGALRRLVDALRIQRDHARRIGKHLEERRDVLLGEAGRQRGGADAAGDAARARDRVVEAGGVALDVVAIERAVVGEVHQQPAEQRGIGARLQPQEQIVIADGIGPARIDHHDARAALLLVGEHALVQHRMAPGRVGADQHQQIGLVEIFIAARHRVGAERAAMAGDRRGHAEPRIGIDIGAADKALHQLVGDVIVLGQQLAGEIERDRARAVARDDVLEAVRDMVERVAPGHPLHGPLAAADHRIEQPVLKAERLAERRALRAQPAEIGGMLGIARYRRAAPARPASPARRSRRRNRRRWCVMARRSGSTAVMASNRIMPPLNGSRASGRTSCRREFVAIGCRVRISSRYQSASPTSPISTAPVNRPSAITSFL